eukprot:CAMPEP_0118989378 /NCGR_PEP_ID=MMETSP1173-20130426/47905_1 /TAXON_ID=1034831 /ORGANISM="Rhizochromulina marina cf, Strain CCMP1243" /LENGTH=33 /DNA_ID= /DNA_START= /DNA_END= /DNA_ORIENTATION=
MTLLQDWSDETRELGSMGIWGNTVAPRRRVWAK